MIVSPLLKEDLQEVLIIEQEAYLHPWQEKDFLYELNDNPFSYYFKVCEKEEIIGYFGFWITFETAQITKVTIKKKYRGYKISHILMDDMINRITNASCENITLEVRVSNEAAIGLYKSHGFKIVSVRKEYYSNHEDAYLMIKELK